MKPSPSGQGDFIAAHWRTRLEARGWTDFERLWALDLPTLDAANTSRGGISTVALLALESQGRSNPRLILKRQQNHLSRTWRHPLQGTPTLKKEYGNIRRFDRCGLETVTPVLFAQRRDGRGIRAILITEYLEAYRSFDTLLGQWSGAAPPESDERETILRSVADLIARMHRAGWRHNCLYPKHVFVSGNRFRPDVRLIDLEKAGRSGGAKRRMTRDLSAFFRRSPHWSPADQARFLMHYFGTGRMTPVVERAWRRIRRRMAQKESFAAGAPPAGHP